MVCMVLGVFYLAGWELGAIEALSLSILVGSSVDYCVHIVEGYLLAGRNIPAYLGAVSFGGCFHWISSFCSMTKVKLLDETIICSRL